MTSICERKKVNKYRCRISSFYRSNHQRHSAKEVFLKILQYSQENTCVGVSLQGFQLCNFVKKRLQYCFPANTAKCLRTPVLKRICKRLLLIL